jgi:hypothetical protein
MQNHPATSEHCKCANRDRQTIPVYALVCLLMFAGISGAEAETLANLETVIKSHICPSETGQYPKPSEDEWCGPKNKPDLSTDSKCQEEFAHIKSVIDQYNAFMRQCRAQTHRSNYQSENPASPHAARAPRQASSSDLNGAFLRSAPAQKPGSTAKVHLNRAEPESARSKSQLKERLARYKRERGDLKRETTGSRDARRRIQQHRIEGRHQIDMDRQRQQRVSAQGISALAQRQHRR